MTGGAIVAALGARAFGARSLRPRSPSRRRAATIPRRMAVFSNVLGFDDAPFARTHRGDVMIVGAVCARTRLDGVITTTVRRDGRNATDRMIAALERSQFRRSIQA